MTGSQSAPYAEANFGGNQRWYTRRYQPASEAEVLDILARHSGATIRALGSRHSWSSIGADAEVSLDMSRLDTVELIERDGETLVRVGAGCRLQDLLERLRPSERTLPTLGAIRKQTVSGAISTGTHGSGRQSLSHYVARVRAAVFDAASGQPRIREFAGGPELAAARCGLGCMGVILSVDLPTVPKFKIAESIRIHASLEEILRLYPEQPLTQFLWTPYSWVWVAFERRPVGTPRLSPWQRARARLIRAANLVLVDYGFHLGVLASRRLGLGAVRLFYRLAPRVQLKYRGRVDDSEAVLTMEHDLFRHEEMELFVKESDLPRALAVVRAAIEVCAGTAAPLPPEVEKALRDADAHDALLALRGSYLHHYPCSAAACCPRIRSSPWRPRPPSPTTRSRSSPTPARPGAGATTTSAAGSRAPCCASATRACTGASTSPSTTRTSPASIRVSKSSARSAAPSTPAGSCATATRPACSACRPGGDRRRPCRACARRLEIDVASAVRIRGIGSAESTGERISTRERRPAKVAQTNGRQHRRRGSPRRNPHRLLNRGCRASGVSRVVCALGTNTQRCCG